MKSPIRVTISFDEPTYQQFENMKKDLRVSQSELMRRAIRFFYENRATVGTVDREKAREYSDMLADGEHVIIDVDHWLLFLKTIENSGDGAEFWETHREIARSHAEQLNKKVTSPQALLLRLEACNLFKLSQSGDNEFTLMTGPGHPAPLHPGFPRGSLRRHGVQRDHQRRLLQAPCDPPARRFLILKPFIKKLFHFQIGRIREVFMSCLRVHMS